MPCKVKRVEQDATSGFVLHTDSGDIEADSVVIATGGLSIPKIGATDFGYRIAKQFGLKHGRAAPGAGAADLRRRRWAAVRAAGRHRAGGRRGDRHAEGPNRDRRRVSAKTCCSPTAACPARRSCRFPATGSRARRSSSTCCRRWTWPQTLIEGKGSIKKQLGNVLAQWLPARLAEGLLLAPTALRCDARLADMPDAKLRKLGAAINQWAIMPNGSEGYRKAEVTRGGVDTRELSQQTMMANKVPGLYFIGEAVDVTGWLGGYNFQWAWASGVAAGQAVSAVMVRRCCERGQAAVVKQLPSGRAKRC